MTRLDEIEAALSSADPELRRRGVQWLPEIVEDEHPRLLLAALGDEDWRVRKEAVTVSLELGPTESLVRQLVDALRPGDNVGLRNAAVETLAAFGEPAIIALEEALHTLDADGRKLAAEALGRTRDASALEALERLFADADPNVRVAAIDHVADVATFSRERGVGVLVSALDDEDVHVRLATLAGLSRLKATVAWESLEALTQHPMLRASALALAARSADLRAALALSQALDDERRSIFAVAVAGLSELVMAGQVSLPVLRERLANLGARARERLLEDARAEGEEGATAALIVAAVAGQEEAIDAALDAFLGERSSRGAERALGIFGARALPRILARIGSGRGEARSALVSLVVSLVPSEGDENVTAALRLSIHDEIPAVASAALIALATLGGGSDLVPVAELVASPISRIAVAAEAALASLAVRHPEAARAFALESLSHEKQQVALAVVLATAPTALLGSIEDDLAVLGRVLSEGDARARRAAVMALGEIGSSLGLDLVRRALDDPSSPVRLAAVSSLGKLRTREGQPLATAQLIELAHGEDPEIVITALRALGETGDGKAVPVLAILAGSSSAAIAVAAVSALGRVDPVSGLPALLKAARSSEAEVVKAALLALGGSNDPRAMACFGAALEHEAWDVRTLAADCLSLFGLPGSAELLRGRLARELEPLVREALDRALDIATACEARDAAAFFAEP